jgi:predicted nucleic-acid-binding Zn-ribbon protein
MYRRHYMKNGTCPRCQAEEIYHQPGSVPNENIILSEGVGHTAVISFDGKVTAPNKYVCTGCGYLEYYLTTQEDLEFIRDNWSRIYPA